MELEDNETLVTYVIGHENGQEMISRNKKGIPENTFSFVVVGKDIREKDDNN